MKSAGNRIETLFQALLLGDKVLMSVNIFHSIGETHVAISVDHLKRRPTRRVFDYLKYPCTSILYLIGTLVSENVVRICSILSLLFSLD